jgi:hypothetical protein
VATSTGEGPHVDGPTAVPAPRPPRPRSGWTPELAPGTPVARTGTAAPGGQESASGRVLHLLGKLVAPAAALTALMYYFGLLHAYWFFKRFGVDYSVMGLTPQDYFLRSADGLFVPLMACGAVGLAGLWCWRLVPAMGADPVRALMTRLLPPVGSVVGLSLVLVALMALPQPAFLDEPLGVPGLALACGVVTLAAASRAGWARRAGGRPRPRSSGPSEVAIAEWAAVFLLVSAGLFWAAGDYSAAVGTRRGNDVIAALPAWPDVVLYSEKSLNLALPEVHMQRCVDTEAAFVYRYDGLKLIVQSGSRLLLLPARWTDSTGTAIVIPYNDSVRLEFTRPAASRGRSC